MLKDIPILRLSSDSLIVSFRRGDAGIRIWKQWGFQQPHLLDMAMCWIQKEAANVYGSVNSTDP